MTPNERLGKAIMAIKFQGRARTQSEIAAQLGYQVSYLSDLINERFEISEKFTNRLTQVFGIRKEWLMTGEGDLYDGSVPAFDNSDMFYRRKGLPVGIMGEASGAYKTDNEAVSNLIEENKRLAAMNEKLIASNEKLTETNQQMMEKLLKFMSNI